MPEIEYIVHADLKTASPLVTHSHEGFFEFVYIEKGKATWEVDGELYETKAGDVFCTKPYEPHSGRYNVIEPCRFWAIILQAPYISERGSARRWMELRQADIELIHDRLNLLPRVISVGSKPMTPFHQLSEAFRQSDLLTSLAGRVAVMDFLLILLQSEKLPSKDNSMDKMATLTKELEQQLDRVPTIAEMARMLGFSVQYFHQLFQKYTHLTPRAYMERLRVKEACRRLTESDATITQIALELGFATSQHFATVFRRHIGKTPTQWRKYR
ncbi:AraC family transcriptional regulator [Paenibacillus albus]|uniref:AraC family transcriptional regulator n=1 Tax=Paenibacillus albus TaxID=2495582 RepID=UPI0013E0E11D|nr:AraC family transcriptional regulator [Paenibacillus albus]